MSQLTIIIVLFICGLAAMCSELVLPGIVIGILGVLAVLSSIVYALATGHTGGRHRADGVHAGLHAGLLLHMEERGGQVHGAKDR